MYWVDVLDLTYDASGIGRGNSVIVPEAVGDGIEGLGEDGNNEVIINDMVLYRRLDPKHDWEVVRPYFVGK